MYCDKRNENDCKSSAFYYSKNEKVNDDYERSNDILINNIPNNNNTESDQMSTSFCEKNFKRPIDKMEDQEYCNTYHVCNENNQLDYYMCNNQLLFNSFSKMCDYPINVECGKKRIYKLNNIETSTTSTTTTTTTTTTLEGERTTVVNRIYGVKILLQCEGVQHGLKYISDDTFCNIFHYCNGNMDTDANPNEKKTIGTVFICKEGYAFNQTKSNEQINESNNSGDDVCISETLSDCTNKFILLKDGNYRPPHSRLPFNKSMKLKTTTTTTTTTTETATMTISKLFKERIIEKDIDIDLKREYKQIDDQKNELIAHSREESSNIIIFDCVKRPNGYWRDSNYCDIFHGELDFISIFKIKF
jgi:hypothetical protein